VVSALAGHAGAARAQGTASSGTSRAGSAAAGATAAGAAAQAASSAPGTAANRVVKSREGFLYDYSGEVPDDDTDLYDVDVLQDVLHDRVVVTLSYLWTPEDDDSTMAGVFLGTWNKTQTSCRAGLTVATVTATGESSAQLNAGSVPLTTSVTFDDLDDTIVTVTGSSTLGSTAWDCAYAITADAATGSTVYQTFPPVDMTVSYLPAPYLQIEADPTVGAKKKKWAKVRVHLYNSGDLPAQAVRATLRGKGVKVKKKKLTFKKVKVDHGKTRTFKVRLKKMKKRKATLTVRGKGIKRRQKLLVLPIAKKTVPKKLAHRYYWGWKSQTDRGWDNYGLYFVDKRWAYVGFPAKGLPKKCSAKKKHCKRYRYHPKTGKVKIGRKKAKVTSQGFTYRKVGYEPLTVPKKGKRFKVYLTHVDFSGCQALWSLCTTWTDTLYLDKKHRFILTTSSLTSFGVPNVNQSFFSSIPPDQRGRYKVLKHGTIRLRYADGKKKTLPIGIQQDVRGKASAKYEGLVMGHTNYYYDS